ncbi:hypothetical protein BC829DRAFT_398225 [Chytridium lagenaria]|nr:hypothetical protein BC829DRAFT_398225 [Chytridium lagenaria]
MVLWGSNGLLFVLQLLVLFNEGAGDDFFRKTFNVTASLKSRIIISFVVDLFRCIIHLQLILALSILAGGVEKSPLTLPESLWVTVLLYCAYVCPSHSRPSLIPNLALFRQITGLVGATIAFYLVDIFLPVFRVAV